MVLFIKTLMDILLMRCPCQSITFILILSTTMKKHAYNDLLRSLYNGGLSKHKYITKDEDVYMAINRVFSDIPLHKANDYHYERYCS